MTRRLPSTPPSLPGFSFIRVLGAGGFADVFLYEQNMPRRLVAVKVLLAEVVNDDVRRMFQAEANLMAQLSGHPSILTVYQASVAADGRPYLVMEYCSATLGQRYRAVQLPIAEVLSIGVRIASAIETAHRQGVLHRDIKPSNILTTAYGHPVLADFGIAATLGQAEASDPVGLSIPWSAPEVLLEEVSGTVASEVWSLGATVYSLLAGRSPFEVPGGDNGTMSIVNRVERARLQSTGRPDVPPSLEAVLARAMSKRPADRQASALEFIRDLQAVEEELALPQTPLEVAMDDWAIATAVDLDERTRLGAGSAADAGSSRSRRRRSSSTARTAPATADSRSRDDGGGRRTVAPPSTGRLLWGVGIAAAVFVGLVVAGLLTVARGASSIPVVANVRAEVSAGNVVFSWDDPGLREGDAYVVRVEGVERPPQREPLAEAEVGADGTVCVTVAVSRDGRTGVPSAERCAEVAP